MRITDVFPQLNQHGIQLDPNQATKDLVTDQESLQIMGRNGKEPGLALEQDVRSAVVDILSDQSQPNWWHSLRKEKVLSHPALRHRNGDPTLEREVEFALRTVAGEAARSLWDTLSGERFEDEFEIADFVGKTGLDQQLSKMTQLAAWELGVSYAHKEPPENKGNE